MIAVVAAPVPDQLLGPVAALAGAIVVIGFLAKILLDYIADLKRTRDVAIDGWEAQTGATGKLTEEVSKLRERLDKDATEREFRRRLGDGEK